MTAYAAVMTGMTWDEVEETMTMPRLKALEKIWEKIPPPVVSLSYLAQSKGYKIKSDKMSKEEFFREAKKLNANGR